MTHPKGPTLIITDGGMPAMLAAAIEAERCACAGEGGGGGPAVLMPWIVSPTLAEAQLTAITSQARFFKQDHLEPAPIRDFAIGTSDAFCDTLALLAAVEVARANACVRIVWPAHAHATDESLAGDLDRIGATVDRALLVSRLAMLDTPHAPDTHELTIETPFVDLTDAQIVDLVIDLDAPPYLCWWWRQGEGEAEQAAAAERAIWRAALDKGGWVSATGEIHTPSAKSAVSL